MAGEVIESVEQARAWAQAIEDFADDQGKRAARADDSGGVVDWDVVEYAASDLCEVLDTRLILR
jgi:hypothetical protein